MNKLDQEESEILDAVESGNVKRVKGASEIQKRHQLCAEALIKKDASILHKFVEGRLHEDNN